MCKSRSSYLWEDDNQNRFFPALIQMAKGDARHFEIGKATVLVDRDANGTYAVTVRGTLPALFSTATDATNHLCVLERISRSAATKGDE